MSKVPGLQHCWLLLKILRLQPAIASASAPVPHEFGPDALFELVTSPIYALPHAALSQIARSLAGCRPPFPGAACASDGWRIGP